MVQAIAKGQIESIEELRRIIKQSSNLIVLNRKERKININLTIDCLNKTDYFVIKSRFFVLNKIFITI